MANQISKVYNANVYWDGDSYAGLAEEVTAPEVKAKNSEHKAVSSFMAFDLSTGIEKLEGLKIKWNTVSPDIMKNSADFFNSKDIMVRSNRDIWENGTKVGSEPVVMMFRGLSRKIPGLGFKQQDNVETESEFSCTAYKLEINGAVIFDIDAFAQVYIVDGVDLLADYRANLGLD